MNPKKMRALLLVLFAALLLNGCGGGDSYETFSLAMDKMAGEGKWSDKGHSTSFFGGALTVEGLTVNGDAGTVEIATVELSKPLAKEELQSILEAKDWKDRQETAIADGLVLKGVKRTMKQGENVTVTTTVDEMNLAKLALTAADANAMNGWAGFLKAARIGKAAYTNLKASTAGGDATMEMALAAMNAEGLAFDAEPLPGLDAVDPSGLATAASSFSAASLSFKDMSMTLTNMGSAHKPGKVTFSLASVDQKGLKGFRSASAWSMSGLKVTAADDDGMDMNFAMESLAFNELDMTEYFNKFMPLIVASISGDDDVEGALNGMQTFGDFFVSPISLKDASMKGLDLKIGRIFGLKIAETLVGGPLKAGSIPAKQTTTVTGLEIVLPESAEGLDDEALELYQFTQDFGLSRFVLDMAVEASYDPATGRLSSNTTKFTIKDLIDMKVVMNVGGLTEERLAALKAVSLNEALMALMSPEAVFGALSIENLDITYTNLGLIERIYAYAGKTQMNGATADQVKDMAVGVVRMGLATEGAQYLANPDMLANSLAAFLKEPKSLRLTATPEPPLSVVAAKAYAGNSNRLLNSLKLTVIANDEAGAQPLTFNIPQAPQMNYEEPGESEE